MIVVIALLGLFFLSVHLSGKSSRVEEPPLTNAELAMILWTLDDELDM